MPTDPTAVPLRLKWLCVALVSLLYGAALSLLIRVLPPDGLWFFVSLLGLALVTSPFAFRLVLKGASALSRRPSA